MKLRIKGNSLRLRIMKSELGRLANRETIKESICFGPRDIDAWSYVLAVAPQTDPVLVGFAFNEVLVTISETALSTWQQDSQIGIYATLSAGKERTIDVLIEKDFACLDGTDADNSDTFDNPTTDSSC